jgi:hypothetical protein
MPKNVHTVQDKRSETFAISRSRPRFKNAISNKPKIVTMISLSYSHQILEIVRIKKLITARETHSMPFFFST